MSKSVLGDAGVDVIRLVQGKKETARGFLIAPRRFIRLARFRQAQ